MSFISNVTFVGLLAAATAGSAVGSASLVALLVITQSSDQVKTRFISHLIHGISSAFQKLFKHFNDRTIATFFSVFLLVFM